jgi:phage-related protein
MPTPTFTPSVLPSPGTKWKKEVKLREAGFGDGYSQTSPDGLNHIRRTVQLSWEVLPKTVAIELDDFFTARGGSQPFLFQPEGFLAPVKWTAKDWSVSTSTPWTFSVTLKEDFSLGV